MLYKYINDLSDGLNLVFEKKKVKQVKIWKVRKQLKNITNLPPLFLPRIFEKIGQI